MKLIPVAALVAAFAFVPAVLAQTTAAAPANKADCEKAKMKWDEKGGKDGKGACMAPAPAKSAKPRRSNPCRRHECGTGNDPHFQRSEVGLYLPNLRARSCLTSLRSKPQAGMAVSTSRAQ